MVPPVSEMIFLSWLTSRGHPYDDNGILMFVLGMCAFQSLVDLHFYDSLADSSVLDIVILSEKRRCIYHFEWLDFPEFKARS